MNLFFKIVVAVIGVTICSFLGWLVAVWLVSESDYRGAAALRLHITGGVLSLIGGILIAIKWIKPIKAFKRFKRDAKRIKPIKRFKEVDQSVVTIIGSSVSSASLAVIN